MTIEIQRSTPYKGNVTVTRSMVNPGGRDPLNTRSGGRDKTESLIVPEHVANHSWSWLVQFNRGREFVMGRGHAPVNARNGFWAGYGWQKGVMNPQVIAWDEPDIAAGMLAGNWLKFNDFSWHGRDDDEPRNDQAVHFGLHTRDSGPLELSNSEGIQAELTRVDPEFQNWHMENHSHWACGWVEKVILFPYKPGGYKLTSAWLKFCELQQHLNDYPILDEDAYNQKVQEETVDPWLAEIARTAEQFASDELDFTGDITPDQAYSFLNDQGYQYDTIDDDSWVRAYDEQGHSLDDESLAERVAIWTVRNDGHPEGELMKEQEADHE